MSAVKQFWMGVFLLAGIGNLPAQTAVTPTTTTTPSSTTTPVSGSPTGSILDPTVMDQVYLKEHSPNRKLIPYTHLREADVMWAKRMWRVIDLREKVNHPLYYPITPIQNRKSMFQCIKEELMKGNLIAYANPVIDDEFRVPMTRSELEAMFTRIDTNYVEDINSPGTMIATPVKTELETRDVIQFWIKEDWVFDKQKSVLEARILGIAPLKESKSESGEVRGYQPLFWVYYPAARSIFAVTDVFNRYNDSERRTLEDIIWKRQFNSFVRKESNVYDRTIAEYKTGLDALLEAERVKDDLFTFEHDVWHF